MRNFDERKAEIFRRSEIRIKERKRNRKRILALCIPLCLCIAILSVIYLPDMMISSDKNNSTEEMNMADGVENSSEFIYTSLEITSNATATSGTVTSDIEKVDIENLYNIIQSAFAVEDDSVQSSQEQNTETQKGESAAGGENHSASDQTQTLTKNIIYTITFSGENGLKTIYTLDGNLLTNTATKQEILLTDNQLLELQKAFGLALTWEEESK